MNYIWYQLCPKQYDFTDDEKEKGKICWKKKKIQQVWLTVIVLYCVLHTEKLINNATKYMW